MCGIVGVISASQLYQLQKRQYLEQALFADTLRGKDGTGLFAVPKRSGGSAPPTARWARQAAPAATFLKEKVATDILSDVSAMFAIIGHNRAATMGSKTGANTHPFSSGPITLVHNGTIHNQEALSRAKADVDSHAIAHALAESPVDDVIKTIDGAFSLFWYDERDGYLNFVRNQSRPMHFGLTKYKEVLLVASEVEMLRWIATRVNLDVSTYLQPQPGALFRWKYDAATITPEVRKLELRKYIPTTYTSGWQGRNAWSNYAGYAGYEEDDDYYPSRQTAATSSAAPIDSAPTNSSNVVRLPARLDNGVTRIGSPNAVNSGKVIKKLVQGLQKKPRNSDAMIAALADEALSVGDRMLFTPLRIDSIIRKGQRIGKLTGEVGGAGIDACIYGLDAMAMGKGLAQVGWIAGPTRFWEVCPEGVRKLGDQTEVICRLIATDVDPAEFEYDYQFGEEAEWLYEGIEGPGYQDDVFEADLTSDEYAEALVAGPKPPATLTGETTYPGLYNTKVSKQRFLELTKDGCYDCGGVITVSNADKVRYVLKATQYVSVCGHCSSKETYNAAATNAAMRV